MEKTRDEYLEKMIQRYDAWMTEGKIPVSSKVIPVGESLDTLQWVLPTNQVIEIIRNARSFAVQDCICRSRHKRCDNPLEVCYVINDYADKAVESGRAKRIPLDDVVAGLKAANKRGLVHLTLYNPEQYVFALCSCCECCCHYLNIMKLYQRPDLIAHADYIAVVDRAQCTECGECVRRCVFGAQSREAGITYNPELCFGCGLCVTTCPTGAITMKLRR